MTKSALWIALALLLASVRSVRSAPQPVPLPFTCAVFPLSTSAADLRARFGAANVTTALVQEDETYPVLGTVVFSDDPSARLEIEWRDNAHQQSPEWVRVRGESTRWRSEAGITLGTSLRFVEQLNRRPFRLVGFGSDVQGNVISWSHGKLDAQDTTDCRIRIRFGTNEDGHPDPKQLALIHQLVRAPEFSSGHPAMQELNPTVNQLVTQYPAKASGPEGMPRR